MVYCLDKNKVDFSYPHDAALTSLLNNHTKCVNLMENSWFVAG